MRFYDYPRCGVSLFVFLFLPFFSGNPKGSSEVPKLEGGLVDGFFGSPLFPFQTKEEETEMHGTSKSCKTRPCGPDPSRWRMAREGVEVFQRLGPPQFRL